MPKTTFFTINANLDTDKINNNFKNIIDDINEAYSRLEDLNDLYAQQIIANNVISQYNTSILEELEVLDSGYTDIEANGFKMVYVDTTTASSVEYDQTEATYKHVSLQPSTVINRFPTTIDSFGNIVPMYDSVNITENGNVLDYTDPAFNMIAGDPKKVYIKNINGMTNPVNYIIESNTAIPIINSVEIVPVFGGQTTLSNLKYGFGSTWSYIGNGNYTNFYAREFIFKQANNASGIQFDVTGNAIGGETYVGFYRINAKYKMFPTSGTVTFYKTIDISTYEEIVDIDLVYDFFSQSLNAAPNVMHYILRLEIYDDDSDALLYDTDTTGQYPVTSPISLAGTSGNFRFVVTLRKYDDISPMFRGIILSLTEAA